jgi:two-component system, response regulator
VSRTILLVEDNESDELLTVHAFGKAGITNPIAVARDGYEAQQYLGTVADSSSEPKPLPGVVLLDLNLPRVGGLDVLRSIRATARTKLLPVVVLTSSNEQGDVLKSYQLGANAYVRKPVDFAEFARSIAALGRFWLTMNELPPS